MEADKTSQLSALLACRSRADLTRLGKVDSPSFPLITLACKHNKTDLLKLLLKYDTSSSGGAVADVPHWCSVEQKNEGHDAVYYSIRSSNVELLRTLLGSVQPELSERLISESYEELLLNNVLMSEEMHLFVQYKLLGLRFFSEVDGALPATFSADIQERIQLLVEKIAHINTYTEVDSHFLYTAKFIAQNIHIVKQQLKSTYNILPWEEMEFCLVSYVSAHIRRHELNIFYLSVLKKERLLNELDKFASDLQGLDEHIRTTTDVGTLRKSVAFSREDVAVTISIRYPHLYDDYKELRDASSLHIMKTYLDAALLADSATRLGQLTIKRALQVSGEYMKNTLDSPNLSPAVSELLLLSAPKETRKVLQDLRNSLSHPHLELEDSVLYSNIQNDVKKIASVITNIINSNKITKIKDMLTALVNCDNVDEFQEIANIFQNVCLVQETDTVPKDPPKIEDLITNIVDKTPYEKKLFADIKDVLDKIKGQPNSSNDYYVYLKFIAAAFPVYHKSKYFDNMIRDSKEMASGILENNLSQIDHFDKERNFLQLIRLLSKFFISVSTRITLELSIEIMFAIARFSYGRSIDNDNVNRIDEFRRQILLDKTNKNDNEVRRCEVKNNGNIISKQISLKLTELGNNIGTDRMCGQLHEHISLLWKDETSNRFMVEALVLDTLILLDSSRSVPNNILYLDGDMPLLNGKCLRNHLAHGNALVDILPTDAWSAVLLNAVKLTESKELLLNCKIGKIVKHDIKQLTRRYERAMSILDKQKEMWKSLVDGNFENFTLGIAGGADICSRKGDLQSTLHYAARGPNIKMIKFLTEQKNISSESKDINGQTALHVAAAFGRDVTVKFLIEKMRNNVNEADDSKKTPLHMASKNGHKKTVEILLSLGANKTVTDIMGLSPLHYAIVNNYLDVVKILLDKDAIVNINNNSEGSTSLHKAAKIGHIEIVNYLLLNDADVNAKNTLGDCPLHLAAFNGHLEVVNTLLKRGAHVNFRNSKGSCPLLLAVKSSHEEIVRILLEKGAFVNIGEVRYKNAPIHIATYQGNTFIVRLLLQYKANINATRNDGFTPLHFAAKGGHAEIVDLLLQNHARADSRDVNGATALHIAALNGHTSVVETLIKRGIDVDTQNPCQWTPLHLAAQTGHQQVVDTLLAAGANVDFVDDEGCIALHHSAANCHDTISEALLKKGSKVNWRNNFNSTPLHVAAEKPRNEKTIQILLKYEAGVDEKWKLCRTALHIAAFAGDSPMVEALLRGKADVDAEDINGATALHLAASGNHKAAVEILLKFGAAINHLNSAGLSALCCAAKNNNTDLLDILIANRADVNIGGGKLLLSAITAGHRLLVEALLKDENIDISITNKDGSNLLCTAAVSGDIYIARALIKRGVKIADCIQYHSPLLIAISFGHTEFVDVLLENGAKVNPVDPDFSPLFIAVHKNKPDIMERLLHRGAKSNIRDSINRRPLELAVHYAQMPNTLMLLEQASDINERGNYNKTLLHIAAEAGSLEITSLLVNRGADVDARDIDGSKPIHIAIATGHHNILDFFLELGMSIDELDSYGGTLMHCAATGGQLAVAQYLIDKHVQINSTGSIGLTPLHCSTQEGHTEMVKFLLHNGAVYDATDVLGRTPSDLTESPGIKELLESIGKLFKAVKRNDVLMVGTLVKDLSQYVNVKSSNNATLLHIASWKGFQNVCDILLKSEANPNVIGKGGNAPLHYASKYSHRGIVESLLKNGAVYNLKGGNMKTPLDFAIQKDIKWLLQIVALCFRKAQDRDVRVIEDITKIRDKETMKAVLKARDTDGNTLVVVAMKNGFPDTDKLKQVLQVNVHQILLNVEFMFMRERFTEALEILKQLLGKRIEILGEDNPGTLDIQYKIAMALYKQSKYSEVMPMLEDIYRKRVEAFGPDHPDSLETRSTTALILHRLGKNEESWDIYQEVIMRQEEVLGEGHEQLIQTKTIAGLTLQGLGKCEEALCLYKHVLKTHKNTVYSTTLLNNMALVLLEQGKHHEAFAMFQSIYEARKIVLGLNHSDTLRARRNMAQALESQHKIDEALQVYQEILAIQKNVLGVNHVDTLYTQSFMTDLYLRQDKVTDALKVHRAGLDAKNTIFGFNHPHFKMDNELLEKFGNSKIDLLGNYIPPCDFNLLKAASKGDRGEVCSLIENGSDVNTADGEGRTALHFAITVEVMEMLLNSGADATAVSQKGNTPLHLATSRACERSVRLLLQNVKRSKPKAAYPRFINAKTIVGGSTALHVAAKKGAANIVSCLLENGACYNCRDRSGNLTPFQCSGSPSVIRLLSLAEKVYEMAERGSTVLPQGEKRHWAAVVNSRDIEHRTPLQLAAANGHTGTARLLARLLKTLN